MKAHHHSNPCASALLLVALGLPAAAMAAGERPAGGDAATGNRIKVTGNTALALGLVTAAQKMGKPLFYGTYPITPASDILHALAPLRNFDPMIHETLVEIMAQEGPRLHTHAIPKAVVKNADDSLTLQLEDGRHLTVDCLIWAIGRVPATDNLNLAAAGIELDEKFVDVIVRRYISEYGDAGVFVLRGDEKIPYAEVADDGTD